MGEETRLILIGYWDGPDTGHGWPPIHEFIDASWDPEERAVVAAHLRHGLLARAYMGYSTCRICGRPNGYRELSDGVYVWPEGLAHYLEDHEVRLPRQFVAHVLDTTDALGTAERDEKWWRDQPH